jgi:hypothetical protein
MVRCVRLLQKQEIVMHEKRHQFNGLPSLSIAQGEIARYSRTGSPLHLAHAARALADALRELEEMRQKELAERRG